MNPLAKQAAELSTMAAAMATSALAAESERDAARQERDEIRTTAWDLAEKLTAVESAGNAAARAAESKIAELKVERDAANQKLGAVTDRLNNLCAMYGQTDASVDTALTAAVRALSVSIFGTESDRAAWLRAQGWRQTTMPPGWSKPGGKGGVVTFGEAMSAAMRAAAEKFRHLAVERVYESPVHFPSPPRPADPADPAAAYPASTHPVDALPLDHGPSDSKRTCPDCRENTMVLINAGKLWACPVCAPQLFANPASESFELTTSRPPVAQVPDLADRLAGAVAAVEGPEF